MVSHLEQVPIDRQAANYRKHRHSAVLKTAVHKIEGLKRKTGKKRKPKLAG